MFGIFLVLLIIATSANSNRPHCTLPPLAPPGYIYDEENLELTNCDVDACYDPNFHGVSCNYESGYKGLAQVKVKHFEACSKNDTEVLFIGCVYHGTCDILEARSKNDYLDGTYTMDHSFNGLPVYKHQSGKFYITAIKYPLQQNLTQWTFNVIDDSNSPASALISSTSLNDSKPWRATWPVSETSPQKATVDIIPVCVNFNSKPKRIRREYFSILGDCAVSDNCVSSVGFPHDYTNHQHCEVTMLQSAIILPNQTFSLQLEDKLRIDRIPIVNRDDFPSRINSGEQIFWDSDHMWGAAGWKICFEHLLASSHNALCTYNITSNSNGIFYISNSEITQVTINQFVVGRLDLETGDYIRGNMCEEGFSHAKIIRDSDANCIASSGYVLEFSPCVYHVYLCSCEGSHKSCFYDVYKASDPNIRFHVTHDVIESFVPETNLIGKGNFASGLYLRGDPCIDPDTEESIERNARLTWLNSETCYPESSYVTTSDNCIYSVHLCPCDGHRKRFYQENLVVILTCVTIVLGAYTLSRICKYFCFTRQRNEQGDVELIYRNMVDELSDYGGNIIDAYEDSDAQGKVSEALFAGAHIHPDESHNEMLIAIEPIAEQSDPSIII